MLRVLGDRFSVTKFSFWSGILLSSLIGGLLYEVTQRSIESDAEERFTNHARQAQGIINVRLKSYSDLLRNAGSMLGSADLIDYRQFHDYVQRLHLAKHYPAVETLNYGVYIDDTQRAAFEARLTKVMSDLMERPIQGAIKPPGVREHYLATLYIEPVPRTTEHYGIDLMANAWVAGQILASRDSGKMQASGTPIAALSGPNNIFLGIRMPIYRHGAPLDTLEQRRTYYQGSIGIAFSVPKLLQGVLDETPVPGMRMTLFDTGPRADATKDAARFSPRILFDSAGTHANPTPPLDSDDSAFSVTLPLDFIGRPWKTTYSVRKSAMYTGLDTYSPRFMMSFGFIGSILLYALLYTLASSRRAALSIAQEMTRELRESQHKLQRSHHKLRRLADHAYQIKELERKRIAREIHDDLGQNLLALRIETEMLTERTRTNHPHLHKRARNTLMQIDTTIKSVRQIINDLRPTVLDLGLSAAVEWQVNQFQRRTGMACTLHDDHEEVALSDHCATAVFRILQESLTNIVRHAHATEVTVDLAVNDGMLNLKICDNGCGLPPGGRNKHGSFGLVGIEERVHILGGSCAIYSGAQGGTVVSVSVPVNHVQDMALPPQDAIASPVVV
ncbi:Oxygen sensor histidine kinase NreB [Massilia sp. Bi118]|uniref:sensor histidine kinase n=1 Tax=Massilia sp. Bi118 TaxID=2822346 RepID=UPI001DB56846|nr:CHASE domain-containing protein [Massilia sp. Bi118]CAH0266358.1 Oxygen sensor histidine kinase NreB [Massilia sp. Bi118]